MSQPDKKYFAEIPSDLDTAARDGYSGIYYGSAFCEEALPETQKLAGLIEAARQSGLSFHLTVPYLTETMFSRAAELAEMLAAKAPGSELISNDLGFLDFVSSELTPLLPVAGRILAFQRTDPEIVSILGNSGVGEEMQERCNMLGHISANNRYFASFLRERRVERVEIQNPLQGVRLAGNGFKYSLHVPYVYVASTRYCQPYGQYTCSGRVPGIYECNRQCFERYFKLRPSGSKEEFLFRGNTIYYENPPRTIPREVDRIVVHKLPS